MTIRRFLLAGVFGSMFYTAGCDDDAAPCNACPNRDAGADMDGNADGDGSSGNADGNDGDANENSLETMNQDLVARVNEATEFRGTVLGVPKQVYWDKDHRDGDMGMDVLGMAKESDFVGTLSSGYTIPGKYQHTMIAANEQETSLGSEGLAKILDTYADVMGESLDEAYDNIQPEQASGVPYSVWTKFVQADSRYTSLSADTKDDVGDYQGNLDQPFGTKDIAQVRVSVFEDKGLLVYELSNPELYVSMENVFEGVEISRDDALSLLNIIDTL